MGTPLRPEPRVSIASRVEQNWSAWSDGPDEMPDTSPYGLDRLAGELGGGATRFVEYPRPAPLQLLRQLLGRSGDRRAPADEVLLAWDEMTARRMLLPSHGELQASGVIWATDQRPGAAWRLEQAITRRLLRRFDMLFCLVPEQVAAIRRWIGSGGPDVEYLKFGIDHRFWSSAPPPVAPLVMSAGSDRDRDHRLLAEVLAAFVDARPSCEVVVQANDAVAMPAGVNRVARMPPRDLGSLYHRASAVLVLTRENIHGSGMTVALEAQSSGRPVVVSATAGMDQYVEHGVTGLLVPPGDKDAALEALFRLVDHPDEAAEMGRRGRARVEQQHTTDLMISDLAKLLTKGSRLRLS